MQFPSIRARAMYRLVAVAALVAPLGAWAGAGTLTVTVEPLAPNVTYSTPATAAPLRPALDTFVGYRVSIANTGGNTINNISFTGAASVTDPQEVATVSSIDGTSACTFTAGGSSISCSIGQLKAGQPFAPFVVFFKAPAKDANAPITADGVAGSCATTDCVRFSGATLYAETTGGTNSPPDNSVQEFGPVDVTLGTNNPTQVKSAVQKSGGKLFTGSGGITLAGDKFATTVTVPAGASYTTAEILEEPDAVGCSGNFSECFRTKLTIPGTFSPYLTIVIRQDASTILKGTQIGSVLIRYFDDAGVDKGFVGDCASGPVPRNDGVPCVAQRTYYKSSKTPGWTPDLDGDFEWILLNIHNGSYKIF